MDKVSLKPEGKKRRREISTLVLVGYGLIQLINLLIVPSVFTQGWRQLLSQAESLAMVTYGIALGFAIRSLYEDKPFWRVFLQYCLLVTIPSLLFAVWYMFQRG